MRATIKKSAATGPKYNNEGECTAPALLTVTIETELTEDHAKKLARLMRTGEQCEVQIEPVQVDLALG